MKDTRRRRASDGGVGTTGGHPHGIASLSPLNPRSRELRGVIAVAFDGAVPATQRAGDCRGCARGNPPHSSDRGLCKNRGMATFTVPPLPGENLLTITAVA